MCLIGTTVLFVSCSGAAGPKGDTGDTGGTGATGATGATGSSGSANIYGDGSAGALSISANTDWTAGTPSTDLKFTTCSVDAGKTLTVPSGLIIRCTGTFSNAGTITVSTASGGGYASIENTAPNYPEVYSAPPQPGLTARVATDGQLGDNTVDRPGGRGGVALAGSGSSQLLLGLLLNPGPLAGAGGAVSRGPGNEVQGGKGGGSLVVLAQGTLTNSGTGTISADGAGAPTNQGQGGGGGGIVILASKVSVTNMGTVTARGANGRDRADGVGPGGGGGGGLIHFISSTAPVPGVVGVNYFVTGGTAGSTGAGKLLDNPRSGGGGGGAGVAGNGGNGGMVDTNDDVLAGGVGTMGLLLSTTADPSYLF